MTRHMIFEPFGQQPRELASDETAQFLRLRLDFVEQGGAPVGAALLPLG
jgi:hypothetical protein